MAYRRKPHDIKINIDQYSRHLKRIQNTMDATSYISLNTRKENHKIIEMLQNSRKIHAFPRKNQNHINISAQLLNKYHNIKSVVKNHIQKQIATVPPKHKKNIKQISQENQKLFLRLINTKSEIKKMFQNTTFSPKKLPKINIQDLSHIYQQSNVSHNHIKKNIFYISRTKHNLKIQFKFCENSLWTKNIQNNRLYFLRIAYNNSSHKSQNYNLNQLLNMKSIIFIKYISQINFVTIEFVRILDKKQILVNQLQLYFSDLFLNLNQYKTIQTELKDRKGKKLSVITIKAKLKFLRNYEKTQRLAVPQQNKLITTNENIMPKQW